MHDCGTQIVYVEDGNNIYGAFGSCASFPCCMCMHEPDAATLAGARRAGVSDRHHQLFKVYALDCHSVANLYMYLSADLCAAVA